MDILSELAKTDRQIRDYAIKLNTILLQLGVIEREMAALNSTIISLNQNMSILRRRKTIAMMYEFKRAKEEKTKANNRLAILTIDKATHIKARDTSEKKIAELQEVYKNLAFKFENNVIEVDFSKKS